MTIRLPHALVGAVCAGCAAADVVRIPALSALLAAAAVAAVGLGFGAVGLRCTALGAALLVAAWGWGSIRLAQLDRSVLAAQIGTFEQALVEVEEPARAGAFDERMRVLVLRWGTLPTREPALLELPLGRAPPPLRGVRRPDHGSQRS